MLIKTLLIKMQ